MIVGHNITEALAASAILADAMARARKRYLAETAEIIATEWARLTRGKVPADVLLEGANAFLAQANIGEVPARAAMEALLHRTVRERALYGWPALDDRTVDVMARRAAMIWIEREGE